MFRYDAVRGDPLDKFFKLQYKSTNITCKQANMYLAEDRIFCEEIMVKSSDNYYLWYFPKCEAFTDPPLSLMVLVKQRKWWNNGAFFASMHVLKWFFIRIWRNKHHSFFMKLKGTVLYIYMMFSQFFSFIIVGVFYGTFSIFLRSAFNSSACTNPLEGANMLENIFILTLWLILVCSLTVKI